MRKIDKIENHLKESKTSEHIINGIKAVLANFPIGSGIASLMSDYIPSQRELRLMEFTENIARDLSELENEINENYLKSDEYAFIFEKCFKGAVEDYLRIKYYLGYGSGSQGRFIGRHDNDATYTSLMIDLIDDFNQRIKFNNAVYPEDNVKGYTIQQIENEVMENKTFLQLKNDLRDNYINSTENKLDELFNYWN